LPELAKEIGVRKIDGVWHAVDPICGHATSLTELESSGFDVADECEQYTEEPQFELPVGVITSTRELSDKLRVTMRRAQQLVAKQVADLRSGNDLFAMGVSHG
jgi:nitrite reductase/ring-hydroxylating ferredoxin subunit